MLYNLLPVRASLKVDGDLTHLDLEALQSRGIKGLVMDLDNTIMAPKVGVIRDDVRAWLDKALAMGFKCIVLSNNKKLDYCKRAEDYLNLPVIGYAAKPSQKNFYKALDMIDLKPEDVAVIGDRPLTDILGGQRLGAYSVLVHPLIKAEEIWLFKFLRALERSFLVPN